MKRPKSILTAHDRAREKRIPEWRRRAIKVRECNRAEEGGARTCSASCFIAPLSDLLLSFLLFKFFAS